jgi:hypothetical protein
MLIQNDSRTYCIVESVQYKDKSGKQLYPIEFLISLSPSNLLSHRLNPKINITVTLIRNLNACEGSVNGIQMTVRGLHEHCIAMEVIGSSKTILISRIQLFPLDLSIPFKLCRRQSD